MSRRTRRDRLTTRLLTLLCMLLICLGVGCHSKHMAPAIDPATQPFPVADEVFALEIALTNACEACDIDKVRELLRQGAGPDGRLGRKARRYAFMHGQRGESPFSGVCATPLLALLAPRCEDDLGYEDSQNDQYFSNRQVDIALLLLAAGADPNLQDRESAGDFPLLFAAQKDNYHAVKLLLNNGADPNLSAEGFTAICPRSEPSNAIGYAVHNEATWTMELLLEADADPLVGGHHYNPFERAGQTGSPEVLGMLLDAYEPWLDDFREQWSAVMTQLIVTWGYAVDEDDYDDEFDARRFQACFKMLVDAGASLETDRLDEDSLIFHVLDVSDAALGKWFFAELAKIPEPSEEENAIQYLGMHVNADLLKQAIGMGIGVNDKDHRGKTMLHYVAEHGYIDDYAFLIQAGAKQDIKDQSGKIPIDYADKYMRQDIADLKP